MAGPAAPERYGRTAPSGIVTPEAVVLEFSEAGLGSRSLAFLVDLAVRVGLLYAVLFGLGFAGMVIGETAVVVALTATGFAIVFVYPVVCETVWNGRTPGKMLVGLRVVTVEGAPVRFRHAAIRAALALVDFIASAGSVAILSALATVRSQRVGDLAAGTIVIRERQAGAQSQPIVFRPPPGWEPFAASLDVGALGEDAYVLVRAYLLRVMQLRQPARQERAAELAEAISRAIGVDLPPGTDLQGFLVSVAAAYQQRHAGPASAPPPVAPSASAPASPGAAWVDEPPPPTWGTSGSSP